FDFSSVQDGLTQSIMLKTLSPDEQSRILSRSGAVPLPPAWSGTPQGGRIADLRSRDPSRVRRSLRGEPVPVEIAFEVISLLARDDVARDAIENLRRAGPTVIEPLITGLLNPGEEFAVRRRIPLVLATYKLPRAVEALGQGLEDRRFEVRYRCGRGLSHLMDLDSALRIAPARDPEASLALPGGPPPAPRRGGPAHRGSPRQAHRVERIDGDPPGRAEAKGRVAGQTVPDSDTLKGRLPRDGSIRRLGQHPVAREGSH